MTIESDLKNNPTPANLRLLATITGQPLVRLRHKLIADYVRGGATVAEAAKKFSTTMPVCRVACRENGIVLPSEGRGVLTSNYAVIAALLGGEKQASVAKKCGLSRQAVNQIEEKMRRNGVFDAARTRRKSLSCKG